MAQLVQLDNRIDDPHGNSRRSTQGKRLARKANWVEGWWDNLGPTPIWVRDKYHLKQICQNIERRTGEKLIPKAFMRTTSQGKGVEWNF